jgi:hypothetical protein
MFAENHMNRHCVTECTGQLSLIKAWNRQIVEKPVNQEGKGSIVSNFLTSSSMKWRDQI